ncbi:MAG: Gfo/Idh/MocA family protein [Spirochaeta sp.]
MNKNQHSNPSPVRWGIIGCGSIAHSFAQAVPFTSNAILTTVASRTPNKAKDFAEEYHSEDNPITAYTTYEELAEDPAVEAVYVATTHNFHYENVLLCLRNKKHVLCEKPITINSAQLRTLQKTAAEHGCFLMEALWTRFLPGIRKLQELIDEEAIGTVRLLQATFGIHKNDDPEHRMLNPRLAGGALLDLGIYPLNFAHIVYGKELESSESLAYIGPTGVDETSAYLLRFSGGRIAMLTSSCAVETPHTAVLYGTEGSITVEDFFHPSSLALRKGDTTTTFDVGYPSTGFQFETEEASRCIRSGLTESPVMPLSESLHIMGLMDRFRDSWQMHYPQE